MSNINVIPGTHAFDETAELAENFIQNERRDLSNRNIRAFVARYGAFYIDTVVVRDATGTVVPREKYQFGLYKEVITSKTGKEVAAAVVIMDRAVPSPVYIDYQCVGGPWSATNELIIDIFSQLQTDNRPVSWPNILGKPDGFKPAHHFEDIGDMYGAEYWVEALERLTSAILMGDNASHDEIWRRIDDIYQELKQADQDIIAMMIAELAKKADIVWVQQELDKKADIVWVIAELLKKADMIYVDAQLLLKADKTWVESQLSLKANESWVIQELAKKADKTWVQEELDKKADKTTMAAELLKKADKTWVEQELAKVSGNVATNNSSTVTFSGNGKAVTPLSAEVRLSSKKGNALRRESDGIALYFEAPPDVALLYVSPSGNDSASGAKSQPLRTLAGAFNKIKSVGGNGEFYILLQAGATFPVTSLISLSNATLIIGWYAASGYADSFTSSSMLTVGSGWTSAGLPRPIITFQQDTDNVRIQASEVWMLGVSIHLNYTRSNGSTGSIAGTIMVMFGCEIDYYNRNSSKPKFAFSGTALTLNGVILRNFTGNSKLGNGIAQYKGSAAGIWGSSEFPSVVRIHNLDQNARMQNGIVVGTVTSWDFL